MCTRIAEEPKSKSGPQRDLLPGASAAENVARGELVRPRDFSGLQIQRHHGIAGRGRRRRIVVAGGDVQQPARGIERGRRPDRCARRSPQLAGLPGSIHRVGVPHRCAVANAQRGHASAKCAAGIIGAAGAIFLPRRHRHEHGPVVLHRRSGQPRGIVLVDFLLPQLVSGGRVQRIEPPELIAEQQRVALALARPPGSTTAPARAHRRSSGCSRSLRPARRSRRPRCR